MKLLHKIMNPSPITKNPRKLAFSEVKIQKAIFVILNPSSSMENPGVFRSLVSLKFLWQFQQPTVQKVMFG